MPDRSNFLLGYGERLTEPIEPTSGGGPRTLPYSFHEAHSRLSPMIQDAATELSQLPAAACPQDEAVALLTLHPQYIAKSYYPSILLREAGLDAIGSRPTIIRPDKWTRKGDPEECESTDLFVAGPRSRLRQWAGYLPAWTPQTRGADQLYLVEHFRAARPDDRIKPIKSDADKLLLEIVLHTPPSISDAILEGFNSYVAQFRLRPDINRRLYAGGLCFLPLKAPRRLVQKIACFSFLRVVREMPKLRPLRPITRTFHPPSTFPVQLPNMEPIDPSLRAAVFDGGIAHAHALRHWVTQHESPDLATALPEYQAHGLHVTSSLLFGSLEREHIPDPPFSHVDHHRVLDEHAAKDPDNLFDVLHRIQSILQDRKYKFINLSIGPDLPIEDDDVHAWTSVLDEILSDGDTLATIAVGNTGHLDRASGNARIQVPADCVNAIAVGAANSQGVRWSRATYSSVGPGRSPGIVKPDLLAFGGETTPFWTLDPNDFDRSFPTIGTSFAAPLALRMAVGIRAHFGEVLSPLSIKALLIHCTDDPYENRQEHGWGRIPNAIEDLVLCSSGVARIVYQGEISPAQYLRAHIPLPHDPLPGNVMIRATLCFTTTTDPQDPGNYTRAGLEVFFRPHNEKYDPVDAKYPKTSSFFRHGDFTPEAELRRAAHKWETTLHSQRTMRATSLKNPVFDIHHNARIGGSPSSSTPKVRYALVITVDSPRTHDLYDRILRRYPTQLQPLRPRVQIPIRT